MRRSTQSEIKAILRQLGQLKGHHTQPIKAGRLAIAELYAFYAEKGYTLTPYVNGDLNLTWIGSDTEPHFNRLLTSPEEALDKHGLIRRVQILRQSAIAA